jgi:hypothetical protein
VTGQSPKTKMTAAEVQRARERDCERRGLTLTPQRFSRASKRNGSRDLTRPGGRNR